jgi:AcrR family transcriptional regulator
METQLHQTRERLMDSALAVFGRRGFPDTRVEDICRAAGSARATFYRHFSGKDEVFDALLSRLIEELDEISSDLDPITPDRSGYLTLHRLMGELIAVAERWSAVVEALSVPRRVPAAERDRAIVAANQVSVRLGAAIDAGGVTGPDARVAALGLVALSDGFGHQVRTWDIDIDRPAVVHSVTALGMRMLHPGLDIGALGLAA